MGQFGEGQAIRRVEDQRFLTGAGQYTDDVVAPGAAVAIFVRALTAHGIINAINTADALEMPGVLGIYTCADLDAAGITDLPVVVRASNAVGEPAKIPKRPALARSRVRYVGEPVALIVAESLSAAKDAAELVDVVIDELPAVTTCAAAIATDAPQLHSNIPGNMVQDQMCYGDEAAVERAFKAADHIVEMAIENQRIAPTPLETRGAVTDIDPATGHITLYCGSQGSHTLKSWLDRMMGHETPEILRVIAGDVGGGFGMRLFLFGEIPAILHATKDLGRPVRWAADRTEGFLSDTHGRDQISQAALAVSEDGRITGLKVHTLRNIGAYASQFGLAISAIFGAKMLCGVYDIPAAFVRADLLCTNTSPTDAYRGAGRPEASYVIERLIDEAAHQLGIDPADFRRRNMISPATMPFTTPLGQTYCSGNYPEIMDQALSRAGVTSFDDRRTASAQKGLLRGLGLSYYIEVCSGGGPDTTWLAFNPDGSVTLRSGFQSTGQGHETAYAQIAATLLGIEMENIRVEQGDTGRIPKGSGTGGSRSGPIGGQTAREASAAMIGAGTKLAAHLWAVDQTDVSFSDGLFSRSGSNETFSLPELAAASFDAANRPPDVEPGLAVSATFGPENGEGTYPNGCHVCEVEIDPDTGVVRLDRYTIHDDLGTLLNPLLAEGQIVGGAAQGIGQALSEHASYDPDTGEMLAATFLDYTMPRADHIPPIDWAATEIPTPNNPTGMKGAGEAGTIGSSAAVMNACMDALRPLGVKAMDMPVTPQRVWRAIANARIP